MASTTVLAAMESRPEVRPRRRGPLGEKINLKKETEKKKLKKSISKFADMGNCQEREKKNPDVHFSHRRRLAGSSRKMTAGFAAISTPMVTLRKWRKRWRIIAFIGTGFVR